MLRDNAATRKGIPMVWKLILLASLMAGCAVAARPELAPLTAETGCEVARDLTPQVKAIARVAAATPGEPPCEPPDCGTNSSYVTGFELGALNLDGCRNDENVRLVPHTLRTAATSSCRPGQSLFFRVGAAGEIGARACTAGSLRSLANSRFNRSITGLGVAEGTIQAYQEITGDSGKPASAIVGTSGNCLLRAGAAIASARSLPDLTWGAATPKGTNPNCTWPLIKSGIAGGKPL